MRERTKEFHLCVVVKTERRFRRTHIGSEKKTKRSERRFEIIRSFGDFSRSGRARLSFCSTTREQQREQQQSKKKRETFERKARGFKRDQNRIFKSLSPLLSSVFSWRGVRRSRGGFFAQNLRKRRSKKAKKEERKRKRKRKRNIALYEKKDNTATTEQRQKSQYSSLVLYSSLVYVVYK